MFTRLEKEEINLKVRRYNRRNSPLNDDVNELSRRASVKTQFVLDLAIYNSIKLTLNQFEF